MKLTIVNYKQEVLLFNEKGICVCEFTTGDKSEDIMYAEAIIKALDSMVGETKVDSSPQDKTVAALKEHDYEHYSHVRDGVFMRIGSGPGSDFVLVDDEGNCDGEALEDFLKQMEL